MTKKDYEFGDEVIRTWSIFVPEDAVDAVGETLRSGWINTGKREKELREKASKKWNLPFCVACNSGTSALRATLAVLGVGPGDEVVSTPYTFIATNTSILEQGATPIFADINYDDLNINAQSIESKITEKTKAIMIVHYGGNVCDLDEIRAIGKKYDLPVIEDSAHAMSAQYRGDYIGSKGDIACFSLQAVKIITSGDGGLIATTQEDWYEKLKRAVWYGMDKGAKKTNILNPFPEEYKGDTLGFKYNMNDIAATLGSVSMDHLDDALVRRREIGERYRKELGECEKVTLMNYKEDRTPNYQIFPVHVKDRLSFAEYMHENNIMVNINNRRNDIYPMFGGLCDDLEETKRADEDVLIIPLHLDLTDAHVDYIIEKIKGYDNV